jgi:peptide-methionine (S)-S-oxide reductase
MAVATFAAGCFWCVEAAFDPVKGVVSTTSGYTGGHVANPSYGQVSSGTTGHKEAVRVVYDPRQTTYETLLDTYWRNVDPVDSRGQFCDKGDEYLPVIFYHTEEQKRLAEESKEALVKSKRFKQPITVKIEPAGVFYVAEDYHQDYYQKNPLRYKFYRYNCGRDARLEQLWGAASTH